MVRIGEHTVEVYKEDITSLRHAVRRALQIGGNWTIMWLSYTLWGETTSGYVAMPFPLPDEITVRVRAYPGIRPRVNGRIVCDVVDGRFYIAASATDDERNILKALKREV